MRTLSAEIFMFGTEPLGKMLETVKGPLVQQVPQVPQVQLDQLVTQVQPVQLEQQVQPATQVLQDQRVLTQLLSVPQVLPDQQVRGIITIQLRQLELTRAMLGLILIQAEYLSFMMDTGLKQVRHQSVQQDH
jgi:hypothetical protein